jgi:hypothetical protein
MTFRSIALVGPAFAALQISVPAPPVLAQGRLGAPDRPSYPGPQAASPFAVGQLEHVAAGHGAAVTA